MEKKIKKRGRAVGSAAQCWAHRVCAQAAEDREKVPCPPCSHKQEEETMKGMAVRLALAAAFGMVMAAGAALAAGTAAAPLSVDQSILQNVDQALVKMQQEMIQKNYSAMLLKDQMRGKMMAERTPQNFMQDTIQPVMMQKMRDTIKPQQMQVMQTR